MAKGVVLPVLRERTNMAAAAAAAASRRQHTVPAFQAAAAASGAASSRPARQRVDWMPMHTSMQAAALRRKPRIVARAGQVRDKSPLGYEHVLQYMLLSQHSIARHRRHSARPFSW